MLFTHPVLELLWKKQEYIFYWNFFFLSLAHFRINRLKLFVCPTKPTNSKPSKPRQKLGEIGFRNYNCGLLRFQVLRLKPTDV